MQLSQINNFNDGDQIKGFYLCTHKNIKTSRLGDLYIDVSLKDSTGTIRGKIWSQIDYFKNLFNINSIVAIKGNIISFNNKLEIDIKFINHLSNDNYSEYGFHPSLIIQSINVKLNTILTFIDKKISLLPPADRKFFKSLYLKKINFLHQIPINKNNFKVKSGYIYYIYKLLLLNDKVLSNFDNLDKNKILICILIRYIGYIEYYNDDVIYSKSKKGDSSPISILGINILNKVLNTKNIEEEKFLFYVSCINSTDMSIADKHIIYVNQLIGLLDVNYLN